MDTQNKGIIFNIQRYSLHDGQGIRTIIFFKGCPLRCPWCSNPESQKFDIQYGKINTKCRNCLVCKEDINECPTGAIVKFGKVVTVEEVLKEVLKDMVFYNTTGGGVTLSGGEVLGQPEFALLLLKELKKLGINTTIETCGQGKTKDLTAIAKYTDTILYDLKILDEKLAKSALNANGTLIQKNLKKLVLDGNHVIPRIPLVPTFTMDDNNINSIINLVLELGLKEVHLLPLHHYGSNKYEALGLPYTVSEITTPTDDMVNAIKSKCEEVGLTVSIGG